MTEPSTLEVVRWLTGITRPVHPPLLFSALMRIIHLLADMALLGVACGGMVAVVTSGLSGWVWLAWVVGLSVVKAVAFYLEQFSGHYVAFKALEVLRTHVFSELWPKAPAVVTHSRTGDVLTSLTRDVDRIEVVYAHTFAPVVAAIIAPAVALVTAGAVYGWTVVAIPGVVLVVLVALLLVVGTRRSLAATHEVLGLRRELAAHVTDSVFGAAEVVGYGRQRARAAEMADIDSRIASASARARRFVALRRAACVVAGLGIVVSVAVVGSVQGIGAAALCGLAAGALRIVEGPRGIEDAVGYLDHSLAAARRLWSLSHAPMEVDDGPEELVLDHAPTVCWEHVTYSYREADGTVLPPALSDVSITVPAGGHLVIAGASGSGKTTLVNLLLRHHDPDSGRVLIDGVPVTRFTLDSLRRQVAVVSQRVELLNSTIAENLRLADPDASDEDLWRVLGQVGLDEEVRGMTDGLETIIGQHAARLSGGQAQRLTVARAILQRPRVLVLDEFTASLDPALAAEIRDSLARCLPGVTVVEISHGEVVGDEVVSLDPTSDPCLCTSG